MENKIYWLKYLAPFVRILFCPVTILILWSLWSAPVVDSDTEAIEEIKL